MIMQSLHAGLAWGEKSIVWRNIHKDVHQKRMTTMYVRKPISRGIRRSIAFGASVSGVFLARDESFNVAERSSRNLVIRQMAKLQLSGVHTQEQALVGRPQKPRRLHTVS